MQAVNRPLSNLALHGVEASRRIEQQAQAGLAPHTLMRRAGLAVARLALAVAPHARRVWIAAGPGNNGGDGLEAAIHLLRAGKQVVVSAAADAARLPADAADALARAQAAGVSIGQDGAPELGGQDLAIDALLGLGASRAPQGRIAELVARLNALACPVLAVDLPTGLDAMTGQPPGDACVRAATTLALLTAKPGLFTGQGRDFAGEVWFDDLAVDASAMPPDAWLTGDAEAAAARTPRRHALHKGSYGDVAIVGGAPGMTGAALLAARAAHAAGAGRVFVSLLEPDHPGQDMALDPARPELMFRRAWWQAAPETIANATVVAGCGGGDAVRSVLPRLLSLAPRLVLDADALNAIAADTGLQTQLTARAARGHATLLTPHPLEAARLLGSDAAAVQRDRLRSAQSLADRWRCVALLKGSGTVIAAPGRAPHVNPTGNAVLATAGTGDVLAGWIGGLWAQAGDAADPFEAAISAAHTHGAAADAAQVAPLRAADLVEAMLAAAPRVARHSVSAPPTAPAARGVQRMPELTLWLHE
ncbi:MAG: NAD(P)H-hydrate dehydratase [Ideonella sp.]|nr:NAD(P)H-hydrate dehydratase [Ideonella sp.]